MINPAGQWAAVCNSEYASQLSFDQQMKFFVEIDIESDCCQSYGICGEQFSLDVIFDDEQRVTATRFRFQHTVQKTQEDYINGLVETRRVTDAFATKLTPYDFKELPVKVTLETAERRP